MAPRLCAPRVKSRRRRCRTVPVRRSRTRERTREQFVRQHRCRMGRCAHYSCMCYEACRDVTVTRTDSVVPSDHRDLSRAWMKHTRHRVKRGGASDRDPFSRARTKRAARRHLQARRAPRRAPTPPLSCCVNCLHSARSAPYVPTRSEALAEARRRLLASARASSRHRRDV